MMKNYTKFKILQFINKVLNPRYYGVIKILIIVSLVIFFKYIIKSKQINDFFKIETATSVTITYILAVFISLFVNTINKKLEDKNKLTIDYNKLANKYCNLKNINRTKTITYINLESSKSFRKGKRLSSCLILDELILKSKQKKIHRKENGEYVFPVELIHLNIDKKNIEIVDEDKMFQIPTLVEKYYTELMSAHTYSDIYNNLNIRLKDCEIKEKSIKLYTQRTTYYNSLVTNRAMDIEVIKRVCIRDIFEFGPNIKPLNESLLSNHLGFNCIIETSDDFLIFILRSNKVSIAKSTLATSVGASLKTKYALVNNQFVTEGLIKGIENEITDELGLKSEDFYKPFNLSENIIAVYRDLVEGGKPQLLVYNKSKKTAKKIEEEFIKITKDKQKNKELDGKKLIFVKRDELNSLFIAPDLIVIGNKKYNAVPSTSASLVMLLSSQSRLEMKKKTKEYNV